MIELAFGSAFLSFVAVIVVAILRTRPPEGVAAAVAAWPAVATSQGWICRTPTASPVFRWSPELVVSRPGLTVTIDTVSGPDGVRTRARAVGVGDPTPPRDPPLLGATSRAHHGVAELAWTGVETDEARLVSAVAAVTDAFQGHIAANGCGPVRFPSP